MRRNAGIGNAKTRKHLVEKPNVNTELAGEINTDDNHAGKVMRKPASIAMPMKKLASCKVCVALPWGAGREDRGHAARRLPRLLRLDGAVLAGHKGRRASI